MMKAKSEPQIIDVDVVKAERRNSFTDFVKRRMLLSEKVVESPSSNMQATFSENSVMILSSLTREFTERQQELTMLIKQMVRQKLVTQNIQYWRYDEIIDIQENY